MKNSKRFALIAFAVGGLTCAVMAAPRSAGAIPTSTPVYLDIELNPELKYPEMAAKGWEWAKKGAEALGLVTLATDAYEWAKKKIGTDTPGAETSEELPENILDN